MELTIEQNKKLIKKFPFLQPRSVWTDKIDEEYDYSYINGLGDLPNGWERLFLLFCKHLKEELDKFDFTNKFRFSQIKEKYGSMRLYNNGYPRDSRVSELGYIFEHLSTYICEYCGEPAKYETPGWITEECESCYKEHYLTQYQENKNKYRLSRKNFYVKIIGYENGKKYTKKYDCHSYWKEYLKTRKLKDEEFISYILGDEEIKEEYGY